MCVSNVRAYILSTPNDDDDDDKTNGMHVLTVIRPIWTSFLYRFLVAAPFHINRHTAYRSLFVFQFRRVRVFCFCFCHLCVCVDFEFCRKSWPTLFHISSSNHLTPRTRIRSRGVGRQEPNDVVVGGVFRELLKLINRQRQTTANALFYAAQSVGGE